MTTYRDTTGEERCEACGISLEESPEHDHSSCYAPWEHGEAGI